MNIKNYNKIKSGKVYLITNQLNNKKYIGITTREINERYNEHIYTALSNPKCAFHRAIKKYGVEHFKIELLEELKNVTEIQLLNRESYYINKFNTLIDNKSGYNLIVKSNNKLLFSNELKEKIKENLKGKKNPFYGKKHSAETIKKIKLTFKKNYKKENHPFYEKTHTDVTKNKIRKSKIGQKHTMETKIKMSESHKGIIFSEKHRENLSKSMSHKYMIYFDNGTNISVNGLQKFARENGYSQGNLWGIMNGSRKKHKNIIKINRIN